MRALTLSLVLTLGCTASSGDGRDDSFGGVGAKEDGGYSTCQLAEVLKLVNESTTTTDSLGGLGLADDASNAIVKHRSGADGHAGTADDDIYDDLEELDKTPFVGTLALGKLVDAVVPRCADDLDHRPFIDSTTFTGSSGGWARDNDEVEVVLGVKGLTGQKLRALLLTQNSTGRTLYQRLRGEPLMTAFTYGYAIDEMPWDGDTQDVREKMPYVALTIESGRYEPGPEGARELSLGTDLMDDTYYDTHGFTLLGNGIELRARARWDDATTVRRLLVAAKFGTAIDAEGNKVNSKVDIRTDSASAADIAALQDDVRRGRVSWSGPITPVRGVYEQLATAHLLPDIGTHMGVLLLEPAAHLRSTRSRYHMNEASTSGLRPLYTNAAVRIQGALNTLARARAANLIKPADVARVNAMETMAKGILDKSLLVARINAAAPGLGLTVATLTTPDSMPGVSNAAALEKNRVIAETINDVMHEFADALDDIDRVLTASENEDFDIFTDMFRAWRISLDSTMARKTTWESFLASHRALATPANQAGALAGFNTYGAAQKLAANETFEDFRPLTAAEFTALGGYLEKMTLSVGERQIMTAGLAGKMLWFDQARSFYVPSSSRATSNFMIDTTDMTDMMSNEEWDGIAAADRTFAAPLPAAKVFNTTLVNELQIELGSEAAYVARLKDLDAKVAADPNNADLKAQLAGARFVWSQYTGAMKTLTEVKGKNILSRLKKAGAPSTISWSAPADSKGNIALKILSDRD